MTKAEKFVVHMLKRVRDDGRLAYLMGPLTEAYDLMTEAYADMKGLDVKGFRKEYEEILAAHALKREAERHDQTQKRI